MKRILLIPIKTEDAIDVRSVDYLIIDNARYLEDIPKTLMSKGKNINNYKYCQFEEKEVIPFFMKIKDKLGNGMQEFEAEKLTFNEIVGEDDYKKSLIEERHVLPIQKKLQELMNKANYMIVSEKLGTEAKEEDYLNLGIEKEKLEKEIAEFDYKKYLNEIV